MKAVLKSCCEPEPMKEVIASKPTPPGARPRLGTETGPTALVNEGRGCGFGGTGRPGTVSR
jgi:hypothetical protein